MPFAICVPGLIGKIGVDLEGLAHFIIFFLVALQLGHEAILTLLYLF